MPETLDTILPPAITKGAQRMGPAAAETRVAIDLASDSGLAIVGRGVVSGGCVKQGPYKSEPFDNPGGFDRFWFNGTAAPGNGPRA